MLETIYYTLNKARGATPLHGLFLFEEEIHMKNQLLLQQINNQCDTVMQAIAKHYSNPGNEELLSELMALKELLDRFLQIKT
jgi:hypothetical protein